MRRTYSPAERRRELAAIMSTLSPSERAAVERMAPTRRPALTGSSISQRWSRMTPRERWEYCKREFRHELGDGWNDAPPQLQKHLAEVRADAEGRAALSEREKRALRWEEGVRVGFTANASLKASYRRR